MARSPWTLKLVNGVVSIVAAALCTIAPAMAQQAGALPSPASVTPSSEGASTSILESNTGSPQAPEAMSPDSQRPGAVLSRSERRAAAKRVRADKKAAAAAAKSVSTARNPGSRMSTAGRRALGQYTPRGPITSDLNAAPANPGPDLRPVQPVRSRPLREVRPIPPPKRGDDDEGHPEPIRPTPASQTGGPEGPRQEFMGAAISAPTAVGLGFDGVGVGLAGFNPSSNPPDVNGHVGATQYVQWNNTSFAVFSKAGALLYGPAAGRTLFQSLGGVCASHNDGDPVVSYDILAGRWVLSQFAVGGPAASASHQCFAVSVTSDATGAYNLYDFVTDGLNFVDYPHTAVWPDGYYMSAHVFNAAGTAYVAGRIYAFERDKMIAGLPARQVSADLANQYGFLPADLDSITPPPVGEAEFVLGPDGQFTNQTDSTRVAITWGATPTITLTSAVISTTGISDPPCVNSPNGRDCVPQPPPAVGADYLDNLAGHFMYRLAYRNNGTQAAPQESLLATAPVPGSASSPAHGAVKWWEFRNAGNSTATPTVFQSGTFDPDTAYRFMPSIAMDKDQNIALGYTKSSTTIKPGVYMTGRLAADAAGTMGAETTVMAGGGSQTANAGNRWGDYSSMTLDPVDQCTFYYTSEYLKADGIFNWSTRIAPYKFPSCTAAAAWGTVSGTITSCATGLPLSGVVVTLSNGFAGSSDASGNYSILVPPGTYSASAADAARNCTTSSPATVSVISTSGATTSQNFCMNGTSNLQTNGLTLDDSTTGNNNGIVNLNECVKLNVPLKNNGCATETAIAAVLTTSTAGVTITQPNSVYPNLSIDASASNSTPFQFQTSNSFVCGTVINFTLTASYASGSKALGISIPTCAGGPNQTIPSSSLTTADLFQTDRLGRNGVPSTCAGKASPGGIGTAGKRYYKTFNFTNTSGAAACYTVNITAALGGAGDIESAAYSPAYIPATLDVNYLGDSGIVGLGTTVGNASYSFTVPAGAAFVVVVNTTGTTTSSVFSGTVSGFVNTTPGPGACAACTAPAAFTVTGGGAYCSGGTGVAVGVSGSEASATYQLKLNGTNTGSPVSGTGAAVSFGLQTAAGTYTVVASNACPTTTTMTGNAVVTITAAPATFSVTGGGAYCRGGSGVAVGVSGSEASATYQLKLNGTNTGSPVTGTGAAISFGLQTAAGTYTVVASNSCPTNTTMTGNAAVTINPLPSAAITAPASVTAGVATPASVADAGVGATYAWSVTGNGVINGSTTGSAISFSGTATGSLTLQAIVTTAAGCSDTKTAIVSVTAISTVTVTNVTPNKGTYLGGTSVTITGSGFNAGASVSFGGQPATNVVVTNATTITATTPAGSPGAVNVTVTNTDTTTGTLVNGYTYKPRQFDPNNSGGVDTGDIFYLVNFLFSGGPAPIGTAGPVASGDANGNGTVETADIFYTVNYLFSSGPIPLSVNPPVSDDVSRDSIKGSVSLGHAALRNGRYLVPVILSATPDSAPPQAIALRVVFDPETVASIAIHRAGTTEKVKPTFEVSRETSGAFVYLLSVNPSDALVAAGRNGVIAEIEIAPVEARGSIRLDLDPKLTSIGNARGTIEATVAKGTLDLSGTTLADGGRTPKPQSNE